jgi:hypothetical protein
MTAGLVVRATWGSVPVIGKKLFLLDRVSAGCGFHSASCPVGSEASPPVIKRLRLRAQLRLMSGCRIRQFCLCCSLTSYIVQGF